MATNILMQQIGQQAKQAAKQMRAVSQQQKIKALLYLAEQIQQRAEWLKTENAKDLANAQKNQLAPALLDRLTLSDKSIQTMVAGVRQIAHLDDPIGSLGPTRILPNGMQISKMTIPLGVIGIIYESRPNVTIDAAALCLKASNVAILRGGSEAFYSNQALASLVSDALQHAGLPEYAVQIVPTTDRAAVGYLATMTEYVDVLIPRGGKGLLQRLAQEAKVPLIMHLEGNCHMYIDKSADIEMGIKLAFHAKTYRYGICGSLETLLVHQDVAAQVLPELAKQFTDKGVEMHACPRAMAFIPHAIPATDEDWATEYLAPIIAIRVVDSIDAAIEHIEQYSSGHTESIITEDMHAARQFQLLVDSAGVYVNLPTVFADGFEYGLGAEIGISTNRLHARGPVAVEGLTTYKWVLTGNGQTRA
ncbi:glutamate-5-semialdehyde dehydrogenase [Pelistega europaea]|uniref:Gamma-glutamyl phosphate reductase n=1 Tax=Pelistega europaea TaxID=106147 RepID=A0A7Y4P5J1_9BURK|nr:glutamate-5-semialdehyde dehydrogenase [Pelistega europaea]NOL49858.1 glutamate-5-semialdehyde dehydrogenase [Pelistega europaea]